MQSGSVPGVDEFFCNFVFEFASLDDKYEKLE